MGRRWIVAALACVVALGTVACKENREPVPVEAEPPSEPKPEQQAGEAPAEGAAEPGEEAAQAGAGEAPDEQPERAKVGEPAPDFTLPTVTGGEETLSAHEGDVVVLEWFNPDCPFVEYAHTEGPLEGLAAKQAEQGVVWLAVNSGAPGKQGAGAERNAKAAEDLGLEHPILLDESGKVGRTYGATNTPQMVVIDPEGTVVYMGAIDNAPLGRVRGDEHREYVSEALADLEAGRDVRTSTTEAYGCSVKYGPTP